MRQDDFKPRAPAPRNPHRLLVAFHLCAQGAQTIERAFAVRGRRKMAQLARAVCECGQHGVPVRNGLVARRFQPAGNRFRRPDDFFPHRRRRQVAAFTPMKSGRSHVKV